LLPTQALWILLPNSDAVVRLDTETNKISARIRVGDNPRFLTFAAGKIWVASVGDNMLTAITSNNDASPAAQLPAVPVAMVNHSGELLIAAGDGRVVTVDPGNVPAAPDEVARMSAGETHLISAGDHAWGWHEGDSLLWRIDATGARQRYRLPFDVEKLTRLADVLWAVAADGRIAEIDADDASILDRWVIEDRPWLLLKDEDRGRLLLLTEDGSVYELPP
jgi:DNA-binding beta-propeller fold protein YncE